MKLIITAIIQKDGSADSKGRINMIDIRNCDCMDLLKSLPDKSIDLIVTDPPYEMQRCGGGAFGYTKKTYHAELDEMLDGISEEILSELIRVMKNPNMYIWGNWKQITKILRYVEDNVPNTFTQILSWHKTNPIPTCCNKYLTDTEYCLFVRGKGVKLYGKYEDSKTYWITPLNTADKKKWNHPTIKPESIISTLIKNSSKERERVLDPFLGSGTTAKCCKNLNRDFIGSEINKEYYETALRRLDE